VAALSIQQAFAAKRMSVSGLSKWCKGIPPCMASYEGISVDTVANVDDNIVE